MWQRAFDFRRNNFTQYEMLSLITKWCMVPSKANTIGRPDVLLRSWRRRSRCPTTSSRPPSQNGSSRVPKPGSGIPSELYWVSVNWKATLTKLNVKITTITMRSDHIKEVITKTVITWNICNCVNKLSKIFHFSHFVTW